MLSGRGLDHGGGAQWCVVKVLTNLEVCVRGRAFLISCFSRLTSCLQGRQRRHRDVTETRHHLR